MLHTLACKLTNGFYYCHVSCKLPILNLHLLGPLLTGTTAQRARMRARDGKTGSRKDRSATTARRFEAGGFCTSYRAAP